MKTARSTFSQINLKSNDQSSNTIIAVPSQSINNVHMTTGAAAKYVDAFMQNVNCGEVNRRVVMQERLLL